MKGSITSRGIHPVKFKYPQLQYIFLKHDSIERFCKNIISLIFSLAELHADIFCQYYPSESDNTH